MFKLFQKKQDSTGAGIQYLVVGLGNPGRKYDWTRHNCGFLALDQIASDQGASITRLKFKSLLGDCMVAGQRVALLKPQTFMNLSGQAVVEAMQFYKLPPERVIVLFDDISLPVGALRIRRKGSDGGHNGMKNIIYLSGSDAFPRIKIGVGHKPNPQWDLADWVLSTFSAQEQPLMKEAFRHASQAVELLVQGKVDEAMNRFNS